MRPIEVEFKFMDSLEFIGTTLEKAIKNLLNINSSYCNHCKKVRELKDPSFKVIGDHIYAYDICNFCKKFEMKKQINTDHMKHFNHVFKDVSLEEKCFLLRKGVYPYEFIDDINKLLNKELPEYKDFHSKLSGKCSEKDYEFAKKLWNYYKNKNSKWIFLDYHLLYLKLDVVLLSDVFDNFREMCHKNYQLDPSHFVSAPHLSFNAALKYTKQELELMTDKDMYLFFEKGIRGGISQIPNSYAEANNPYWYNEEDEKVYKLDKEEARKKKIYDSKKFISYILYVDANNLYGWAMCQKLSIGFSKCYVLRT